MLDYVPILNALIILGFVGWLGRTITQNSRRERDLNRKREENFSRMIQNTNAIGVSIVQTEKLILDHQKVLDDKMDALARFVDAHSTNITLQQGQLFALAKTDVESSRREELRRLKELKTALERLMGVAMTSRQPPSPNDVLALENIDNRINELEEILG